MSARLRQAVLAARDLESSTEAVRAALGLGPAYADPDVGFFGLHNAVCPLGDTFVEVVSPTRDGTAAGRHLDRHGDGGYMLIFQLDDLAAARERAQQGGIRAVWQADLPDIAATHLHPGDMGGTIVSIDQPDPPGSWRWAGPDWTGKAGDGPPGRLRGATLGTRDPQATARRWAGVLGLEASDDSRIELSDGGVLRFVVAEQEVLLAVSAETAATTEPSELRAGGLTFEVTPAS